MSPRRLDICFGVTSVLDEAAEEGSITSRRGRGRRRGIVFASSTRGAPHESKSNTTLL